MAKTAPGCSFVWGAGRPRVVEQPPLRKRAASEHANPEDDAREDEDEHEDEHEDEGDEEEEEEEARR